jgi:hypothetical protein
MKIERASLLMVAGLLLAPAFILAQESQSGGVLEEVVVTAQKREENIQDVGISITTFVGWVHTRHETETAKELTPMLLTEACKLTEKYLSK